MKDRTRRISKAPKTSTIQRGWLVRITSRVRVYTRIHTIGRIRSHLDGCLGVLEKDEIIIVLNCVRQVCYRDYDEIGCAQQAIVLTDKFETFGWIGLWQLGQKAPFEVITRIR